mmetsp:Transcript_21315/g.38969  ORF Transcript_21315/g.38969 Transcript_21315/m.38969 type:complete len:316 (-) Transcript_21315:120-1067(-)
MKNSTARAAVACGAVAVGLKHVQSVGTPRDSHIAHAVRSAQDRFCQHRFATADGSCKKDLQLIEAFHTVRVPCSVRCDTLETRPAGVTDSSQFRERASLAKQGFELRKHTKKLSTPDLTSKESIDRWLTEQLFPQVAGLVKDAVEEASLGRVKATHVIDYTLHTTDGVDDRNSVKQVPVLFPSEGGMKRMETGKVAFQSGDNDTMSPQDRVLFVNLWQPVGVHRSSLPASETHSLSTDGIAKQNTHLKADSLKYNSMRAWYCHKNMQKDEALVFLTWSPINKFTPQTVVEDEPDAMENRPRRGVEIRFVVKLADE